MKTAPTSTISSSYYFWKLASFYRLWKHHFMNIELNIPSPIHSHLKVIMVAIWHTLNKHYMNNMRIKKGEWTIQLMYILWSIIIAQQVRWWIPCQVPLAVSAQWNGLFKFGVKNIPYSEFTVKILFKPYLTQPCIDFQGHKTISTGQTYIDNCSCCSCLMSCPVNKI